ncbi:MAG: N,N-dimethylformamidase beta subunit family domain-containing protein [Parvibaculaceae bacterium]
MSAPVLLAYCDPFSAEAGEQVRFMVSCEGAGSYDAGLVRLLCCETGPAGPGLREMALPSSLPGRLPARRQHIDIGSYGIVEDVAVDLAKGFTFDALMFPTLLDGRPQAIIGTWRETEAKGACLMLDSRGALALRIGDGAGASAMISTDTPLRERQWIAVAGSFDPVREEVVLIQRPLGDAGFDAPPATVVRTAACRIGVPETSVSLLIAAWTAGHEGERLLTGGHFDGKIERPRLLARPLDAAGIEAFRTGSAPLPAEDGSNPDLAGAWDFSGDMSSDRFPDRSSRQNRGRLINCPTRAVTGHNWTGEFFDWRQAPEQYGAIHFHSDDLGDAGWESDFAFTIPDDLESGVHAVRLSAGTTTFHVPFVVRAARAAPRRDVALLLSTATYWAYANCRERFLSESSDLNQGRLTILDDLDLLLLERRELGLSTYDRHADGSGVVYGTRLRPVLNNRPVTSDITVAYDNFAADLLVVDWLARETSGFDVLTDEDLHRDGLGALSGHRVVVTSTHPEYASKEMRDALDAFLAGGGRLIYLGGNGLYWKIAFHPDTTGIIEVRRAEDGVRAWESEPGEAFHGFTGEYGGLWRRQGRAPNCTLGVGFIAQGFDASAPYQRTEASLDPRARFIFEGVEGSLFGMGGLLAGGAAGLELDCASEALGTPRHALTVASSVGHSNIYHLVPEELNTTNGFTDGTINPQVRSDIVFFETPPDGAVFSVGSIAFAGSLSINGYDNDTARMMGNVLRRFADPEPFAFPHEVDTSVRRRRK